VIRGQADSNWKDFIGQQVQICKNNTTVRVGYVEAVTHAADALWLQGYGVDPRMLYAKADGFSVKALSTRAEDNR
jgi:hypothetical protein